MLDSAALPSSQVTTKRFRSVPCPPWWIDRVKAELAKRKMTKRALAEAVGVSEFKVHRCLTGQITTYELIVAISKYLDIQAPVAIAENEGDVPGVPTPPTAADSDREITRKNLVRFRDEVGLGQLEASVHAHIPLDELESYEAGARDVPRSVLAALATVYQRRIGDFIEVDPRPREAPIERKATWFGIDSERWAKMTAEQRERFLAKGRELDAIAAEADAPKFRKSKEALNEQMRDAKSKPRPKKL